jgi:hypothetical protein
MRERARRVGSSVKIYVSSIEFISNNIKLKNKIIKFHMLQPLRGLCVIILSLVGLLEGIEGCDEIKPVLFLKDPASRLKIDSKLLHIENNKISNKQDKSNTEKNNSNVYKVNPMAYKNIANEIINKSDKDNSNNEMDDIVTISTKNSESDSKSDSKSDSESDSKSDNETNKDRIKTQERYFNKNVSSRRRVIRVAPKNKANMSKIKLARRR